MNKKILFLMGMFIFFVTWICQAETYVGEPSNRVKINLGATPWKFTKSDPANAQNPTFNDAAWQTVGIPHTWGDTLSFLNSAAGGPGPGYDAITWYRKKFTLDNSYAGRKVFIEFEGAGIGAAVYINGTFIKGNSAFNTNATHVIAFIPFIVDITPYVKFGGDTNVLAVKVSSAGQIYQDPGICVAFKYGMGCNGLFRPVWMHITDKVYIPANVYSVVNNWGTYVATVSASDASAEIKILTHVKNENGSPQTVTLTTKIVDAKTKTVVWSGDATQTIPADSAYVFDQTATVTNPKLWYPNNSIYGKPNMHRVYHIVKVAGKTVDVFESPLGIRVITWNNDFPVINGKPHYLWGGASRYDYPALGCAVPEEVQWRDVKYMADCGGNLWRPGHATHSAELTAACDAYGVMLIQPSGDIEGNLATAQLTDYKRGLKKELHRDMVIRDRNNPSILAWEVSNGPIDPDLAKECRQIDSTWDPVHTRAMSDRGYWLAVPSFQAGVVSIISCSYTGCEIAFHQQYPMIPSWGAEAWSGSRTLRANYDNEITYATEYVRNWKNSKRAKCFGLVQWYLAETPGEEGIGRSFGTSMMDWSRIPKMLYYIYQACWTNYSVKPVVKLAHHWNRSGNVTVNAFSNCPKVRLLINGTSQGEKVPFPDSSSDAMLPRQCQWNVTWQAGTLRAEGLDANGNVVCFDEIKTAGSPARVVLTVDAPIVRPDNGDTFKIYANGSDAATILATVVDENGNWCPTANNNITFSVTGPGNYRGGADNNTTGGQSQFYHSPGDKELTAEGGKCRIAVRSTFTPGVVTVSASASGLSGSSVSFTTYPVPNGGVMTTVGKQTFLNYEALSAKIFNTSKGVRYFLNRTADISINVFDATGRCILNFSNIRASEGWHTLAICNPNLSNVKGKGVYVVKISSNDGYRLMRKVVVMH
jgi:hypothetical protein